MTGMTGFDNWGLEAAGAAIIAGLVVLFLWSMIDLLRELRKHYKDLDE